MFPTPSEEALAIKKSVEVVETVVLEKEKDTKKNKNKKDKGT